MFDGYKKVTPGDRTLQAAAAGNVIAVAVYATTWFPYRYALRPETKPGWDNACLKIGWPATNFIQIRQILNILGQKHVNSAICLI